MGLWEGPVAGILKNNVKIISRYMSFTSCCTPQPSTVLCVNYFSIKVGKNDASTVMEVRRSKDSKH